MLPLNIRSSELLMTTAACKVRLPPSVPVESLELKSAPPLLIPAPETNVLLGRLCPLRSNAAPEAMVTSPAPSPKALSSPNTIEPLFRAILPVIDKLFPLIVRLCVPALIRLPEPEISPDNVWPPEFEKLRVPALLMSPAYVPSPRRPVTLRVPAWTDVGPVKLLLVELKIMVPLPDFVSDPVPVI